MQVSQVFDMFDRDHLQHLRHVAQMHAHAEGPIAAIVLESICSQQQADQADVRAVHCLEREARRRAVEVGLRDQVFDCLQYLRFKLAVGQFLKWLAELPGMMCRVSCKGPVE